MEIHPLHEVTKGLRLKGSEAWITNLPAERKAACQSPTGITRLSFLSVVSVLQQISCGLGLTRWLRS